MKLFLMSAFLFLNTQNIFAEDLSFKTCGGSAKSTEVNIKGETVNVKMEKIKTLDGIDRGDFYESNQLTKLFHITKPSSKIDDVNNHYFGSANEKDFIDGEEIKFIHPNGKFNEDSFYYLRTATNTYYLFMLTNYKHSDSMGHFVFLGTNTACAK